MIVSVASLPNPPLLLPAMTGRPIAEVEELRSACWSAIATLVTAEPEVIVIVGGVQPEEIDKPLSVTVGRSLLNEVDFDLPVEQVVVPADTSPHACAEIGRELAAREGRVGLLVMADGSARRTIKAPGYLDDRAAPFDARVQAALSSGDGASLAGLEPELAAELLAAGRAAWQVMSGATAGTPWRADVPYADDPFGVWYPVAVWLPEPLQV
jgi:hypothetical protein